MDIHYSDGRTVRGAVVVIWEDNNNERAGFFRAFWAPSPDATTGSPVVGYCSPGGSHRTIRAAAREAVRLHPGETVYRNGRPVRLET
jgi:hypothetical protein